MYMIALFVDYQDGNRIVSVIWSVSFDEVFLCCNFTLQTNLK